MTDLLNQVKRDAMAALKAGDRDRAGKLRLVLSELQKAEKEGGEAPHAVLRRERKRRLDAAEAYREAGREDRAASEQAEAALIQGYLPAELSDEELSFIVAQAIEESGASGPRDMGRAMGVAVPWVAGRADGKRIVEKVREALSPAGDA